MMTGLDGGMLGGLLGLGGGILVPAFHWFLRAPIRVATGSSLACFAINALISTGFSCGARLAAEMRAHAGEATVGLIGCNPAMEEDRLVKAPASGWARRLRSGGLGRLREDRLSARVLARVPSRVLRAKTLYSYSRRSATIFPAVGAPEAPCCRVRGPSPPSETVHSTNVWFAR